MNSPDTPTDNLSRRRESEYKSLEEYGVIGNLETVALIANDGGIDWCCLPHVESPSIFARILDSQRGGHFTITPTRSFESEQTYVDQTNVLQTRFRTSTGHATVTDFMPVPEPTDSANHRAIYRRVTGDSGTIDFVVGFEPRFDYARTVPTVEHSENGVRARGGGETVFLSSTAPFEVVGDAASTSFTLTENEVQWFVLGYDEEIQNRPDDHHDHLDAVIEYWRNWTHSCPDSSSCTVGDRWHSLAVRSELVLKLLIHRETGTICAAPTTSLPEVIGGVRNWDYRYNWIRDSAFAVQALAELGHLEEAEDYFTTCLTHCAQGTPAEMQPLYGLHGETDLDESTLDNLSGYRGSAPVRLGNKAASQRQLDVYGELVVGVYQTIQYGADYLTDHWDFIRDIADHVCDVWQDPDVGIWEVRSDPEHFVYSKVMCWAVLDRAIKLVDETDVEGSVERWQEERNNIREAVLRRGYNDELGSFVRSFDRDEKVDAATLRLPLVGFLPADDPRIQGTIDAIIDRLLSPNGLVRRLEGDDGLPGEEGAFVVCSFWLINALTLAGRVDEATELFEEVSQFISPLGLLAEEIDPETGEQLGNYPQAFSHIGLITSILFLEGQGTLLDAEGRSPYRSLDEFEKGTTNQNHQKR